jgi:hypothetical protein
MSLSIDDIQSQDLAQQLYVAILGQSGVFKDSDLQQTARFCRKAARIFFETPEHPQQG